MPQRKDNLFWSIVIICYFVSLALSFAKIYVYHRFPIYYSEEEIPSTSEILLDINENLK